MLSHVQLFATPLTVAHQASLYWSGLPYSPGDLPNPGIEPRSPTLQADSLPSEPPLNTIKLLEKSIGRTLFYINHSNNLLNLSPKAKEIEAKINKQDLTKLKSFCTAKETINKTKRQSTKWKKIFANNVTDKGFIPQIYKELIQLNTNKTTWLGLPWWFSGKESACQCKRYRFNPWSRKIPYAVEQLKAVRCNSWACVLESGSRNYWIHALQLMKPKCPRTHVPQHVKPPQWEALALQLESRPCLLQLEETCVATKTQHSQK